MSFTLGGMGIAAPMAIFAVFASQQFKMQNISAILYTTPASDGNVAERFGLGTGNQKMNAIMKLEAPVILAGAIAFCSTSANAWWNDDDHYDRWHGGPWHGRYPGYGYDWGGYPGYPGYGWAGYPYRQDKTIIVLPKNSAGSSDAPEPKVPE